MNARAVKVNFLVALTTMKYDKHCTRYALKIIKHVSRFISFWPKVYEIIESCVSSSTK